MKVSNNIRLPKHARMKSTTAMMYHWMSFALQVGHLALIQDVRRPQCPHFI
jgi:hypothetical protein